VKSKIAAWKHKKHYQSMKSFVFIFRPGKRLLTPEEQSQRAAEARTWALAQINADRKFDPRLLGAECCLIAPVNENAPALDGESAAMAITFLEATDFNEAVNIAKTHPGPRYGVTIEVHEWSPPPALATLKQQGLPE
jgi:hypothetical protein